MRSKDGYPLPFSPAAAEGDDLVGLGEIDRLDHYGYSEHLCLERKVKLFVEHREKRCALLRLAVGIHGRLLDKLVEPSLTPVSGSGSLLLLPRSSRHAREVSQVMHVGSNMLETIALERCRSG